LTSEFRISVPAIDRSVALTTALPAIVLCAVYAPALAFGYVWDDWMELASSADRVVHQLRTHPRVLYYLSFLATNPLFDAPWQHRLVNLVLFLLAVLAGTRVARRYGVPYPALVALAAFSQPMFVYPVTWISQRSDLFLQLFLMLTLLHATAGRGLVYLVASDISKSPWIFHNVWYMWRNRGGPGQRWRAVVAAVVALLILGQSLIFWSDLGTTATSPMTHLQVDGVIGTAISLAVRMAKVVEALFITVVPFPAFYKAVPVAAFVAVSGLYAACWFRLAWLALHSGSFWRRSGEFMMLVALMSIPFAANSDPRVIGPAIPFVYFAVFVSIPARPFVAFLAALLVLCNLFGVYLNFHLSDTGVYEPVRTLDYVLCGPHEMTIPMDRWRCERADIAHVVVKDINALLGR
jgi:hypothetical protein